MSAIDSPANPPVQFFFAALVEMLFKSIDESGPNPNKNLSGFCIKTLNVDLNTHSH